MNWEKEAYEGQDVNENTINPFFERDEEWDNKVGHYLMFGFIVVMIVINILYC